MSLFRVIPINVPQSSFEGKLLLLKLFGLFYVCCHSFFTIYTVSYIVGIINAVDIDSIDSFYNIAFSLLHIFKVCNVVLIVYTKYFNYNKRNYFREISNKGFMVYFIFLPALSSAGVYQILTMRQYYNMWLTNDRFPFIVQFIIFDAVNSLFYLAVAMALIEYSRWKFEATTEDIDESESDEDVKDVINLVVLNRYNIIITILGLSCITLNKFIYTVLTQFVDVSYKLQHINYSFYRIANKEINNNLTTFYPCVMLLCLISIFFLTYRIKDYWHFANRHKNFDSLSGKRMCGLNLSTLTQFLGLMIITLTFFRMIPIFSSYVSITIDAQRIIWTIFYIIALICLIISIKSWNRAKKHKSFPEQLFLGLGFLGESFTIINYIILASIGINETGLSPVHFRLALIEGVLSFVRNILLFVFIDISMTKVHIPQGGKPRINLLALSFCLQLSLSIIGIEKNVKPLNIDRLVSLSFTYTFIQSILTSLNNPFALFYNAYICGYIGVRILKWYGIYEDSQSSTRSL